MQDRPISLHDVAGRVHCLLGQYDALDYFRNRVREAAQEHIEAMKEREHREKLRRDAVAKDGVLSLPLDEEVVKKKTKEGYFPWSEEFRGRIKLPPDVTEPLMPLTHRPQFPNRPEFPNPPLKPRCLSCRIPRDNWSEEDERKAEEFNEKLADWENAVREYHKKRADWEREKLAYMASPKRDDVQVPSKWEEDWRPIFEFTKKRGFPADGDGGFPYTFTVEAWLPGDLHSDRNLPTDPLPVPETEKELSPNFKYAGLAAIFDANWGGSERIAPWGVVKSGGKVSPASGLPSEWKTPEEPGSYRAASWYWRLVKSAKELDDRNTTIVDSWVADVEADLAKAFPKPATATSTEDKDAKQRAPRGPTVDECKALFVALLTLLPDEQHNAVVNDWSAQRIVDEIVDRLKPAQPPTARTFQRMLVKEGYRQPKGAGKNPDEFDDTHWDDPDHPQRRRVQR